VSFFPHVFQQLSGWASNHFSTSLSCSSRLLQWWLDDSDRVSLFFVFFLRNTGNCPWMLSRRWSEVLVGQTLVSLP
jgi:hypothetical protein